MIKSLRMLPLILVLSCKTNPDEQSNPKVVDTYQPSTALKVHKLEKLRKEETKEIETLIGLISSGVDKKRDAHPKSHGCYVASLEIDQNLPQEFRRGFFELPFKAQPANNFETVMRFSSAVGNPKIDDRTPSVIGLALKVRLPPKVQSLVPPLPDQDVSFGKQSDYSTFDILLSNNQSEFLVNNTENYLDFFKAVGAMRKWVAENATATPQDKVKNSLGIMENVYVANIKNPVVKKAVNSLLPGALFTRVSDIAVENYHSTVAYGFDESRAVKYSLEPCSDNTVEHTIEPSANFLSERLLDLVSKQAICFNLHAQFHNSNPPYNHPSIEDSSLPWAKIAGDKFSRVFLGKLTLDQGSKPIAADACEVLAFNPAHALPNQRGIGSLNRARRLIYPKIQALRNTQLQSAQ